MADFVRITQSMAEQQFDALLVLGMRNCAYLAGAVSEGPWLNEPQGLSAMDDVPHTSRSVVYVRQSISGYRLAGRQLRGPTTPVRRV